MTIGLARDPDAEEPEREFAPEAFNGWPLFGRGGHGGHVPIAGPEDDTPIEAGIDLTSLFEKLGNKKEAKLFVKLSRADGSEVEGELLECGVRNYDEKGKFFKEQKLTIKDGKFGKSPFQMGSALGDGTL